MTRWLRALTVLIAILGQPRGGRADGLGALNAATADAGGATGYADRLIDEGGLAPLRTAGGDSVYDRSGVPRYLRIQAILNGISGAGSSVREDGFAINAGVDTLNFGALSVQGVLRVEPLGGSLALIQRGMPFDGGWSANNSLGTVNSPEPDLARSQYRFYVPTFPMVGLSTEWLRRGGLQLQAAVGQPGLFDGVELAGFNRLGGSLLTAAGQWSVSPRWTAGLQVLGVSDVTTPALTDGLYGLVGTPVIHAAVPHTTGVSLYSSVVWHDGSDRDQLNIVQSSSNHDRSAVGVWFDGAVAHGRLMQNYGAFWLQKDLQWGYLPISSDSEGLYYRASYRTRRWLVDGGFDSARSISGSGLSGTEFTGNLRYQLDPATGIGGGITYRLSRGDGVQANVFAQSRNRYGVWRLQLDETYQNQDSLTRLSLDETWKTPVDARLMTSLYVTHEDTERRRTTGGGAALSGSGNLFGRLSWDGSVSYDTTVGAGSTGNVNANIGVTYSLTDHWSLAATYYDDRNRSTGPLGITPIVPLPLTPVVSHSSAILLSARFDMAAGTRATPIGAADGSGAGSIEGRIFFDANDNGRLDAGETGPANVTVRLDGRYSAVTDANGRFQFPFVASGPHRLEVIPDNLPLPWSIPDDGGRTVVVHTRERLEVDIPASREL